MKAAEGGGFGAADYRSYTFWISLAAWVGFLQFVRHDLSAEGAGHLRTAWGVSSAGWIWTCTVLGWLASTVANQRVAVLYTRYTGRLAYGDDRIGYAKSGGRDIAAWAGFLAFLGVLGLFTLWVPEGILGWLRPVTLLVATALLGWWAAGLAAGRLYTALYGPPRYRLPSPSR